MSMMWEAKNFLVERSNPTAIELDSIEGTNSLYDARMNIISTCNNLSDENLQWYFNYIDFTRLSSQKHPKANSHYLLELGFVPVVYLPTCLEVFSTVLEDAVRKTGVPVLKKRITSFELGLVRSDMQDIWMSKLDAADWLKKRPEEISTDVILKEVLRNELR